MVSAHRAQLRHCTLSYTRTEFNVSALSECPGHAQLVPKTGASASAEVARIAARLVVSAVPVVVVASLQLVNGIEADNVPANHFRELVT